MAQKRVFVCGLHQESNSFNPTIAGIELFNVCEGKDVVDKSKDVGVTVRGMLTSLEEDGVEAVGGIVLRAPSGSPVDQNLVEWFISKVKSGILEAGNIDGVLMSMHGATVSNTSEDVCGDIFEQVRKAVGEDVIISASFDLHANITEKVLKNVNYVSGYHTYPHLDLSETGYRAGKRMGEHFNGKPNVTVCAFLPMLAPPHGYTTQRGGLKKLMDKAKKYKDEGIITDYNIFQVQPWLDVKEIASTVVICATSEEVAKNVANDLALEEFTLRKELQGTPLFTIKEVVDKALKNKSGKPIVLVDSADSPNAGACGDSATVLNEVLPYKDVLRTAIAITDVNAVKQAFEVGVGNTATFTLGATIAPKLSKPVTVTATVRSLHDGYFFRYGPQERGEKCWLGKTAVLQSGEIFIHLSCRGEKGDLAFYRSFGIEPELCNLVCVKACTSFRAGYEKLSQEICNTDTPGAAGCNLKALPFEKLPHPVYPFEEITIDSIIKAKRYR